MSNTLKINFSADTINGQIIKDLTYKPEMSSPLYRLFPNILFIPTIKLDKKLFSPELGEEDIKKIFLSPSQMDIFLSTIKNKYQIKPQTIQQAQDKGIIYNNIRFILNMFFNKGSKFQVNNKKYIINKYDWDNKYKLNYKPGKKTPSVAIHLNFSLIEGEELSFIDSTRLNCMQRRQEIIDDYYELVGLKDVKPAKK